jgi:hypothetical protein
MSLQTSKWGKWGRKLTTEQQLASMLNSCIRLHSDVKMFVSHPQTLSPLESQVARRRQSGQNYRAGHLSNESLEKYQSRPWCRDVLSLSHDVEMSLSSINDSTYLLGSNQNIGLSSEYWGSSQAGVNGGK